MLIVSILVVLRHHLPAPKTPVPSIPAEERSFPSAAPPPKTITFGGRTYAYASIKTYAADISLIPNFTQKTSVESMRDTYQCAQAVNGGFYDTKNTPLGYFLTDSYTHPQMQSALFNGYFTVSSGNEASITSSLPTHPLRIGLQSGPLLFMNNQVQSLRIQNDENARRIVAAITDDGGVLFIVLYTAESPFNGPLLADLPSLLSAVNTTELLHIVSALNLDGGSASAFFSPDTTLSELTPSGSVFCIK
jgi:uncharacterized protein YigE (DUF2233 family)